MFFCNGSDRRMTERTPSGERVGEGEEEEEGKGGGVGGVQE